MVHFYFIDFQLNRDFPSQLCVFNVKSLSVTQRSGFQENAFKKSKNRRLFFLFFFFSQNYRLKYIFYSNWKQFQVLKIVKLNLRWQYTKVYGQNAPTCDPVIE